MKKQVEKFIRDNRGEPHYQGSTRIMYVDEPKGWEGNISFLTIILQRFPSLPFTLKLNNDD